VKLTQEMEKELIGLRRTFNYFYFDRYYYCTDAGGFLTFETCPKRRFYDPLGETFDHLCYREAKFTSIFTIYKCKVVEKEKNVVYWKNPISSYDIVGWPIYQHYGLKMIKP
jgi:hypothetical protein